LGECDHYGGFNGILKKKRQIEVLFSELGTKPYEAAKAVVSPLLVIHEHSIAAWVVTQQFGHRRVRRDGDFRLRKSRPHSSQSRGGHYRIPDPVGRTNEDLPDVR
jgi:hypothetical protein